MYLIAWITIGEGIILPVIVAEDPLEVLDRFHVVRIASEYLTTGTKAV